MVDSVSDISYDTEVPAAVMPTTMMIAYIGTPFFNTQIDVVVCKLPQQHYVIIFVGIATPYGKSFERGQILEARLKINHHTLARDFQGFRV